jgi:hypothetical protein
MARVPKTSDLIAVEKALNVEVKYLGALAWYSISDCLITRNQLAERLSQAGLEERFLPGELNIRDAFRRACHAGERKREPAGDNNFVNILIRQVKADSRDMVVQVVKEVVDAKNIRLSYEPMVELTLLDGEITVRELVDVLPEDIAINAAYAIVNRFQVVKNHYEGYHIRDLVMRVLRECDPVAVRPSGGVYFVPQVHEEKLQALKSFVNSLAEYSVTSNTSSMWSIPVIDVEEHRQMIRVSLEEQVNAESERLISEMTEIIKSGKTIRQKTAKQYIDRVRNLARLVKDYKDLLETKSIRAESNLEFALIEAQKLLMNAEAA